MTTMSTSILRSSAHLMRKAVAIHQRRLTSQSSRFTRLYSAQNPAVNRPGPPGSKPSSAQATPSFINTEHASKAPQAATATSPQAPKPTDATTVSPIASPLTANVTPAQSSKISSPTAATSENISDATSNVAPSEKADTKESSTWMKYAWRAVSSFLVVMISYKTLNWYVARLEADGKRRQLEMEEDRKIAEEIRKNDSQLQQPMPFATGPISPSEASNVISNSAPSFPAFPVADVFHQQPEQQSPVTLDTDPTEYFEKMAAQIVPTSSELDELYAYKRELEGKVSNAENSSEASNLKEELEAVLEDIRILESKGNPSS